MKNTKLGKYFFKKLLKDPTVSMHYEEESSKTAIACAVRSGTWSKEFLNVRQKFPLIHSTIKSRT